MSRSKNTCLVITPSSSVPSKQYLLIGYDDDSEIFSAGGTVAVGFSISRND